MRNETIITMRLFRSKLRKREESSHVVSSTEATQPTHVVSTVEPLGFRQSPSSVWHFPPLPPQPNLYIYNASSQVSRNFHLFNSSAADFELKSRREHIFLSTRWVFRFLASDRGQGQEKKFLSWSAFKKCLTGVKNLPFVHPEQLFATIKNLVYEGNNASWKGSSSFNFLGDIRMASKKFFGEFRIFARSDNIYAITLKIFAVTNRRTWDRKLCTTKNQ